jgi:FMN reductase [NAD(P)H]
LEAIIHQETYHDYTPADIDDHYKAKEELEENRHFVEVNNKETLAQVFTDCRYTKRDNEAMSAGMIEALKRQGFL